MGNILDQIVETKRGELIQRRARCPLHQMRRLAAEAAPARDFYAALAADPPRGVHLIAEIKRKSPSAGLIRPDFDPVAIAKVYHRAGASALSVLTDQPYFDGRLEFLPQVKKAVPLPVLRKDFMIDPYQIYESRAAGADAVLLIGEVLPPDLVAEMLDLAFELGMTSLIEIHERHTLQQLQRVVPFSNERRSLLGINNRDLKIQRTDLATSEQLAGLAGKGTIIISESGIKTRADVERLIKAGARGLLIGETFMRSSDMTGAILELLGGCRSDAS
ncbi:MAG TPA: indole-3-glycerol phosphate synthase TrpC [Phycisphaerae bacterium]|nr:indole-3-glycerol phosphate synthase TrpC [Phycisphaerae bacterium]HRY66523.1 indole-3-glycerol phosphate synthase TrpC [Phycisphaerae bacterium]HSA28635.1 indole-3-glycerol phosphate synthase TrpC [Phycisphaerae bacterium]